MNTQALHDALAKVWTLADTARCPTLRVFVHERKGAGMVPAGSFQRCRFCVGHDGDCDPVDDLPDAWMRHNLPALAEVCDRLAKRIAIVERGGRP